jgi:hypothetical protein
MGECSSPRNIKIDMDGPASHRKVGLREGRERHEAVPPIAIEEFAARSTFPAHFGRTRVPARSASYIV